MKDNSKIFMRNDLIPANVKGKSSDLEYSITVDQVEMARYLYMRAVKRMQNPACWHKLAGWASASFMLVGPAGEDLPRLAQEGDYIRVDIPGPGSAEGAGFDWVKVGKMEEYIDSSDEMEWTGMKVCPASNPLSQSPVVAHFFRAEASSTYIIQRECMTVTAFYHGRNEVVNTEMPNAADRVRNVVVAAGGILGLSNAQWAALSKGFLT